MSATAGPASGLVSSITESWSGRAPAPVNHWSEVGLAQSSPVTGVVPERSASSPGARAFDALIERVPVPGTGVAAQGSRATSREVVPESTVTLPEEPLVVETAASEDPGTAPGH